MGFKRWILECPSPVCEIDSQLAIGPAESYYDFACHCGFGKRWTVEEFVTHELDWPWVTFRVPVQLACDDLSCTGLTTDQAIANKDSGEPISPVRNWNFPGINCPYGHLLTKPYKRRKSSL